MLIAAALYLLVGTWLGWAWNRAEIGRASLRRVVPSFASFVFAWPVVLVVLMVVAALWSRLWKRSHARDENPVARQLPARPATAPTLTGHTASL